MKSNAFILKLIIFALSISSAILAQQLPQSYFNNTTPVLFNPAFWNTDLLNYKYVADNQIFISANKQYWGIDDSPLKISLNYDRYYNHKMAFGLSGLSDSFGPYSRKSIGARYALAVDLNEKSFISGGINYALNFNIFDASKVTLRHLNDPIGSTNESNLNSSISVGIFYSNVIDNKNVVYTGASIQNIVSIGDLNNENNEKFFNIPVYTFNFGYAYYISENYSNLSYLEPSIVVKNAKNISTDIDLALKYYLRNLISFKPGIRMSSRDEFSINFLHFDLGFNISHFYKDAQSRFEIGYSFEYPINANLFGIGSSNEINLTILF
ncbi:MAG: type IX secretion system membrane protein PorP/SprF [Saprospiraceae bacterium]